MNSVNLNNCYADKNLESQETIMNLESTQTTEYSATDYQLNIKNGYMIQKKDRILGVLLVFSCGAIGALYLGWKPAKELFLQSLGFSVCLALGMIFPLIHVGTVLFGIMMICHWFLLMADEKYYYELTPNGRAAKAVLDKKSNEELDKTIEATKAKAGVFLKNISDKLISNETNSQDTVNKPVNAQPVSNSFCHECGTKLHSASRFCGSCGCKIENAA